MHEELVAWFRENRRPLPWRIQYDPYQVWVSEVMLQQTQVETALPYYERFIAEFPDARTLANATEEQVLKLWAGLGYYSRARNLLAAARIVAHEHAGQVPDDYETLRTLPGVGQYMAGAILSIAFNRPYPVVDGNVRRVLSRLHGWADATPKRLWEAAEALVHQDEPRYVNQAIMELGAKVCTFKSPRCLTCPVQSFCTAFKTGKQHAIPCVKKRPETIRIQLFAVVQSESGRYLMRQSRGLWEFPMFNDLPHGVLTKAGTCRHTITHHRLEVSVYTGRIDTVTGFQWQDVHAVPVSSLTRKILSVSML